MAEATYEMGDMGTDFRQSIHAIPQTDIVLQTSYLRLNS